MSIFWNEYNSSSLIEKENRIEKDIIIKSVNNNIIFLYIEKILINV
jgi:hypothetical protein